MARFCIGDQGHLYSCSEQEWANQHNSSEVLPIPAASSHDQNTVVTTGYNNFDFHLGTVTMAVGSMFTVLMVILCCYCMGRKATNLMKDRATHALPLYNNNAGYQQRPPPANPNYMRN